MWGSGLAMPLSRCTLKTALELRDWAPPKCIGEWACPGATITAGW